MNKKSKNQRKNNDFNEIFGIHAVIAAIKNKARKPQKLIITSKIKKNLGEQILKTIPEILELPLLEINKIYGSEKNHQGIILLTSKLKQPNLNEIINTNKNTKDIIVMLDQVNDTNNIGSIMRSCSLFKCKTIIVSKDNSPDITSAITKAASGAVEKVNYIKVSNLSQTIEKIKKNNYWVIGLDSNKDSNKKNFDLPKRCLLILGSERRGLRELTKKKCDFIKSIPIIIDEKYGIESLNVSNACAIALYAHFISNE